MAAAAVCGGFPLTAAAECFPSPRTYPLFEVTPHFTEWLLRLSVQSRAPQQTHQPSASAAGERKKTRTYSVQNDETDGIFPCEQVHHLPFYSRGGDELYILWMLLCFWEDESAIQVMLSCGPPGSRPVWQTHAHITPTGTRPGAVSSKGHFQNTAVWCIFLNSKI